MNRLMEAAEWSDIRVFLAVLDAGNLVAAAEALGISQPTAGRRLSGLEAALGVPLFVRTGRRMELTDAGKAIEDSARKMQREMDAIQRTADGQARGLCGSVTISATEGTGSKWLIPVLAQLRQRYPDITVELIIEGRNADLVKREADIALRMGRPTQLDLICRKLATIGFGFYASHRYLERFGEVCALEDLHDADWIRGCFSERESDLLTDFLHQHRLRHRIVLTTNSPAAQLESTRQGLGMAVLSHRWAMNYSELVRVLPAVSVSEMELWLVTHEDLRHSARIKAVAEHIAACAAQVAASFADGSEAA